MRLPLVAAVHACVVIFAASSLTQHSHNSRLCVFFIALQQCRLCEQYDQTQNCVCALFERLRVSRNEATVDNDLCETIPRNCDAHCFASIPGSWQSLCRVSRGGRGDNEGSCEVLLRIELIVAIPPSHSTEKQ